MSAEPPTLDLEEYPSEWYNRSKQPRCNICGRFAAWNEEMKRWMLKCTWYDYDTGGYEHD